LAVVTRRWTPRQAWLVFVVALAVRLVHVWQMRRAPFADFLLGDSQSYDAWAQRIAAGDWIGHDVFYQAPLYPYFLALVYTVFGHSLNAVRLIQACIGSGACVLLGAATARLIDPDLRGVNRVGPVAGFALALYAPAIFFDALIQKTVLDVLLVCVSVWIVARLVDAPDRRLLWLALGMAMGALSLTRENALVFIGVLVLWAFLVRPPLSARIATPRVAAFAAGLLLLVAPVGIRNSIVGGGFYVTTSQLGPNLYLGNNPHADGMAGALRAGRGSPEYERQDATELAEYAVGRALTPGEVSAYWTGQAVAWIRQNPAAWLKLTGTKFALIWNRAEVLDTESQESHAEWSWPLSLLGWFGHFGVLLPLAAIGLYATRADRARLWVLYAMAGAYAATIVVFYVYARYRYPLVPFVMIFAAAALERMRRAAIGFARRPADTALNARAIRTMAVPIAIGTTVAVLSNWPMLSADSMRAMTEHNLGAALQSSGRLDPAIEHYRRALQLKPDDVSTYSNLGAALAAEGDRMGAVDSYRKALDIDPDFTDANYNLANELLRSGRGPEAVDHFRRALRGSRGSPDVHMNLGLALVEQGATDEGLAELRRAAALAPDSAEIQHGVGNALAAHDRAREALEHLGRAVQLAPADVDARYDYATTLLESGRAADAVPELRAALRIRPGLVEARNNLGLALASLGQLDDAIGEFEQALRVQPDFTDARRNLQVALAARRPGASVAPR
jgi:tetratricopeptide (TPR) repeat protein